MFKIISAQRYEVLEEHLLHHLMQPGSDPFHADQVLIPSAALQRRLTFAMADRYGICARVDFSFVATWLWQQVVAVLKDFPERSPFDANTLRWRIYKHFDNTQFIQDHPRLQSYLAQADATMRFDLAQQVASLFDQYTTFRADWLEAWASGQVIATHSEEADARADELWQAALWRILIEDIGEQMLVSAEHPSQLFLKALGERARNQDLPEPLKQTVHIFCIPSLPPLYLAWLKGLAKYRDVVLYVLDPCQEYWHDLVTAREQARLQVIGELDYQEVGHRLLASWGRQTQAYVQLLMAQEGEDPVECLEDRHYASLAQNSLLSALQSGIHHLQDLDEGALFEQAHLDGSIQIHSCHSLTRELEVLQDCLLRRFKEPHPPRPADILVVVPNLDQAAPLIEGVFGHAPEGCRIPYKISGVAPISVSPCAQGLLTILKLARSRLSLGEVIEALRYPLIADAVGIPHDEVDTLAQWLKEADVRWGLNAHHRTELHLPATQRHSFEDGLDRLWMGYALPENFQGVWLDQLPIEGVEGTESQYLGAFAFFIEKLHALHAQLQKPLTPEEWSSILERTVQVLIKPSVDAAQEVQALSQVIIERSREIQDAMQSDTLIPVDVLMRAFEEGLQGHAKGGTPTGSVTFAAMPSLRGLPHRFVCILGLNDQEFPSPQKHIEFDLISRAPRYGDRQRHHDERNLFLDLVLAARERLHLSYVGKDRKDNAKLPPSVVLSELIDALVPALSEKGSTKDKKESIRRALVIEHPLQAFSEVYFQGERERSFRKTFAQALQERARNLVAVSAKQEDESSSGQFFKHDQGDGEGGSEENSQLEQELDRQAFGRCAPFFEGLGHPELEPEWRTVQLSQLIRFIQNPVRFFLTQRLGLELPWVEREWPETEDFEPNKKATSTLAKRLIPTLLSGTKNQQELILLAQAGREFPEGKGGEEALISALAQIEAFATRVRERCSAPPIPDRKDCLVFDSHRNGMTEIWTLEGTAESLWGTSQVRYQYGDWGPKEALEVWIRHLWLSATADEHEQWSSEWLGAFETQVFTPLTADKAQSHLKQLLNLYAEGLESPVHFFPHSAWAYIHADTEKQGECFKAAEKKWMPSRFNPFAEGAGMEYQLAFRGQDLPLDDAFERYTLQVFEPLMACVNTVILKEEGKQ